MLRLVVPVLMACCITVSSAAAQQEDGQAQDQQQYASSTPEAEPAGDEWRLNLGVSVGYGVDAFNGGVVNPYGIVVRPRLGLTLPEGIYLGAIVNYGLGSEEALTVYEPVSMQTLDAGTLTLSSLYIGGEFGGDIEVGERFVVRPTYGIGSMTFTAEACDVAGDCASESKSFPSMQFGLQLMLRFGAIYGGLDFAYMMVPNKEAVNPADQAFIGVTVGAMPGFSI